MSDSPKPITRTSFTLSNSINNDNQLDSDGEEKIENDIISLERLKYNSESNDSHDI